LTSDRISDIIYIVRGREERFLGEVRKKSEKLLTNLSNSDIMNMFQGGAEKTDTHSNGDETPTS
jgi:hypothetical protein